MYTGIVLSAHTVHIHCGDCSAEQLRKSGVRGTVKVIHDPVCCGPTPRGASGPDWYRTRAEYLVSTGVPFDPKELARNMAAEDAVFDDVSGLDEVVLWFDHCLFDQSILVRSLDRLSRRQQGGTRLSLICVGEFPGFARFKGLGELSPSQMASLVGQRHEVTESEKRLASRAWAAMCSPDPQEVQSVIDGNTSAFPYLGDALRRQLEQFPSTRNGLSRLEKECLAAVAAGNTGLAGIFNAVSDMEPRPYLGDTMLWDWVDRLAKGAHPALRISGPGPVPRWETKADLAAWAISLTDTGRALLANEADWAELNGIDRWVGGVHLDGHANMWRWDDNQKKVVRP
jgi:hypothetical protein